MLEKLKAARIAVKRTANEVVTWMDAEGRAGRLRQNFEAPGWDAYEAAEEEWDRVLREFDSSPTRVMREER